MDWVVRMIHKIHEVHKVPYEEMVILYRVKSLSSNCYIDIILSKLKEYNVPCRWTTESSRVKINFSKDNPTVKISTIESSKGLDFQAVFIVNIDNMPFTLVNDTIRERLFYTLV
jgi:superfamily I DNA/RNA helicase